MSSCLSKCGSDYKTGTLLCYFWSFRGAIYAFLFFLLFCCCWLNICENMEWSVSLCIFMDFYALYAGFYSICNQRNSTEIIFVLDKDPYEPRWKSMLNFFNLSNSSQTSLNLKLTWKFLHNLTSKFLCGFMWTLQKRSWF